MTHRSEASNPAELPEGTLCGLFLGATERHAERVAYRYEESGRWHDLTYREVRRRVALGVRALRSLGLERGARAAILSNNRPEWAIADYACLCAGVIDVPIYPTLTPGQVAYILRDAGVTLLFASDAEQLAKIEAIRGECPELRKVVVFTPPPELPDWATGWETFLSADASDDVLLPELRAEAMAAEAGDVATILYTSGTTGDPKGVMLTHANLHSNVQAANRTVQVDQGDSSLSFLPLSHVFQRMVDYLFFDRGVSVAYARSIETVAEDLRVIRPTVVVSVPRLYEKVHARVTAATGVKGALVRWATRVGDLHVEARLAGRRPGAWTALRYALADRLVFSKLRAGVGGRLRFFVSGGAPLAPEINRFFLSAGILILEGYGLTETSPVTNVNSDVDFPRNFRIGTVGKPVPGTEIRIAEDGEILIRGPQVMKGYYRNPEATREAITEDGWFHTGDVGEIDEDGFLRITDRKKDLIVTAGGKNVAPQPIENRLKQNRYVDQAVLLGDRRHFVSLLLVPDFSALEGWAKEQGLPAGDRRALLDTPQLQRLLRKELGEAFAELSRYEQPKKVLLLDEPFTVEDGSLTPTQKVKRRVVEERFRQAIDAMYADEDESILFHVPWAGGGAS